MTAKAICEQEQSDIQVMSSGAKLKLARTSFESAAAWCAHALTATPPARAKRILQLKGFGGGVPLNTETAAVNPRAGIE
jgi:hypothetical protein